MTHLLGILDKMANSSKFPYSVVSTKLMVTSLLTKGLILWAMPISQIWSFTFQHCCNPNLAFHVRNAHVLSCRPSNSHEQWRIPITVAKCNIDIANVSNSSFSFRESNLRTGRSGSGSPPLPLSLSLSLSLSLWPGGEDLGCRACTPKLRQPLRQTDRQGIAASAASVTGETQIISTCVTHSAWAVSPLLANECGSERRQSNGTCKHCSSAHTYYTHTHTHTHTPPKFHKNCWLKIDSLPSIVTYGSLLHTAKYVSETLLHLFIRCACLEKK
jgi:hypothetical protein